MSDFCRSKTEHVRKIFIAAMCLTMGALSSCHKDEAAVSSAPTNTNPFDLEETNTPAGFNYRTTSDVDFEIQLNAPDGNPITGVPVTINKLVNDSLIEMYTMMTDETGLASGLFNVPSYITDVVISPNYIGVPNDIIVPISGNTVTLSLSGARTSAPTNFYPTIVSNNSQKTQTILRYKYLSPYNSQGVPSVLAPKDIVTSQMLTYINNSLPESKPLTTTHPTFLNQNINTDLDITQAADVWITFVHEGAGYTNTLCYYKYQTNNPPTSSTQIDTAYVVFPNASYYNSGGGMRSGDKVYLGAFPAGTSIGFICVSNGWTGAGVGDGYSQLFSDKNPNVQANAALKQQSVLLYDNTNKIYYLGFEDINRNSGSCDNDFNDIVFYAKSNPITAISTQNMPLADNGQDQDHDGVSDVYDDFPTDANLAYKSILPSAGNYGTLAFEDLWPAKGDYDFNDLVVDYQFEQWLNAKNKVKEMKCRFAIRAVGAHYSHGFGFQMNIGSSDVANVTGMQLTEGTVSLNTNKTENSQNNATIIAFDNDYKVIHRPQGNMLNTETTKPFETPDTVSLNITFANERTQAEIGAAPFNPFIIVGGNRGKEVHLAGYSPTKLANKTLFGTLSDNTSDSKAVFYKTKNNLPYAIHLPEKFTYPVEKAAVNQGNLKFIDWASSGGMSYADWYKDLSGYKNTHYLFIK